MSEISSGIVCVVDGSVGDGYIYGKIMYMNMFYQ